MATTSTSRVSSLLARELRRDGFGRPFSVYSRHLLTLTIRKSLRESK